MYFIGCILLVPLTRRAGEIDRPSKKNIATGITDLCSLHGSNRISPGLGVSFRDVGLGIRLRGAQVCVESRTADRAAKGPPGVAGEARGACIDRRRGQE